MVGEFMEYKDRLPSIFELLQRLGVTRNYKGFSQTACAVELCREDLTRLDLVTKWVYPAVAARHGTSWGSVERNIRTVRGIIWVRNRPLLEELALVPLLEMPHPARLLSILTFSSSPSLLMVHGSGEEAAPPQTHLNPVQLHNAFEPQR